MFTKSFKGVKYDVIQSLIFDLISSEQSIFLIYLLIRESTEMSSLFKKIIPILLTVAGEAYYKSLVSKMKFTLVPNDILSPVGKVNK